MYGSVVGPTVDEMGLFALSRLILIRLD